MNPYKNNDEKRKKEKTKSRRQLISFRCKPKNRKKLKITRPQD